MVLSSGFLAELSETISAEIHSSFSIDHYHAISGGDIHQCFSVSDTSQSKTFFIKVNKTELEPILFAEAIGIKTIAQSQSITVPQVVTQGVFNDLSYLVLEYFALQPSGDETLLAQQLAKMHTVTAPYFGFISDNFIGRSVQKNQPTNSWLSFWRDCRLLPQLELAFAKGYQLQLEALSHQLLDELPKILGEHRPVPSLVHGDLWGGNKGFNQQGTPVIFDPACYYGDREVDVAMTCLFGGFSSSFYRAYNIALPLPAGYKTREPLYNLYHQLNHLNLFGSAYLSTCVNTIRALL